MSNDDVHVRFLKQKCFKSKVSSDGVETMSSDSSFQIRGPETSKALLPTVDSLKVDTIRQLVLEERRAHRPGKSATWTKGPRQSCALPCKTLYISSAILYLIRSGTRSQWRLRRASVTWSENISDDRPAVPSHSIPTADGAPGRLGCRPEQCYCSRVWKAPAYCDSQCLKCGYRYRSADLTQLSQHCKALRYHPLYMHPYTQVCINVDAQITDGFYKSDRSVGKQQCSSVQQMVVGVDVKLSNTTSTR